MGSDREARALGAGETIEVNGKKITLRPITVRQLCELEREALSFYKRQYLETFRDNLDLLDENTRVGMLSKKIEEVASWDVSKLPQKVVYDASPVPINDAVRSWIKDTFDVEVSSEIMGNAILSMALDSDRITADQLKKMTGKSPRKGTVRYDQWWVTASTEGMVRFVWHALMGSEIAFEEVREWSYSTLIQASRAVEKITSANMGNG